MSNLLVPFDFNPVDTISYAFAVSATDPSIDSGSPITSSNSQLYTVPAGKYAFVTVIYSVFALVITPSEVSATAQLTIPDLVLRAGDTITVGISSFSNNLSLGSICQGTGNLSIKGAATVDVIRVDGDGGTGGASFQMLIREHNIIT